MKKTLHDEAMDLFDYKLSSSLDEVKNELVEKQIYICFGILMEFFIEHNLHYRFIYRYLIHPVYLMRIRCERDMRNG